MNGLTVMNGQIVPYRHQTSLTQCLFLILFLAVFPFCSDSAVVNQKAIALNNNFIGDTAALSTGQAATVWDKTGVGAIANTDSNAVGALKGAVVAGSASNAQTKKGPAAASAISVATRNPVAAYNVTDPKVQKAVNALSVFGGPITADANSYAKTKM